MITASVNELNQIAVVCETANEGRAVAEINCVTKVRNKPLHYILPLALNSVTELRRNRAAMSPELEALAAKLELIDKYVAHIKKQEHVDPLQPVPIKAPYALFQHQVKAYNIALALFGRGAKRK